MTMMPNDAMDGPIDKAPENAVDPPALEGLLASVQAQVDRLRSVQSEADERDHLLEERDGQLDQAADRLAAEREAHDERERAFEANSELWEADRLSTQDRLTADREAYDERERAFDVRSAQWESDRQSFQERLDFSLAELDERDQRSGEREQTLEQLESELDALRREHDEASTRERNALDERLTELSQQENTLREREHAENNELATVRERAEDAVRERDAAQEQVARAEGQLAAAREREEQHERELAAIQQQVAAGDDELATVRAHLAEEHRHAGDMAEAAHADLDAARADLDQANETLEDVRQSSVLRSREMELQHAQLAHALDAVTESRDEARSCATELSRSLEQLHRELQAVHARCVMADGLQVELAEMSQRAQVAEAAVTELEDQLTDASEPAALQELESMLAQVRQELDHANTGAAALQRSLDEQTTGDQALAERAATFEASVDDLQQQLVARDEERSSLQTAMAERVVTFEASVNDLQQQLAARDEERSSLQTAMAELESRMAHAAEDQGQRDNERQDRDAQHQAEIESLITERDALLTQQNEMETRNASIDDKTNDLEEALRGANEQRSMLRSKATRVAGVSEHIERRRARLKRMRLLIGLDLDSRRSAAREVELEEYSARARHLEQQRVDLDERTSELAQAEKRMVRRWAKPRALAAIAWSLIIAVITAGASWLAADHFHPALRTASVTIHAKAETRTPAGDALKEWATWHASVLNDEPFRRALARRFDQRQMDAWRNVDVLTARLVDDFTIDATERDAITFTLSGTDADEITRVLDVVASTIAVESSNAFRTVPGAVWATLPEESRVPDGPLYAKLADTTVSDERLQYAGMYFGGGYFAVLVLIGITYLRLVRVKQEFDGDGRLFTEDATMLVPSLRKNAA